MQQEGSHFAKPDLHEHNESHILNDESKVWKKNAPFLYDCCITHILEWPSLTVQWLPLNDTSDESKFIRNKMVIGTQTSGGESNYLMIAQVRLPNESVKLDSEDFKLTQKQEGQTISNNSLNIEVKMLHDGEVNKALSMPQKYNIIATKTNSGQVHIFDYSQHKSRPESDEVRPELRLAGHTRLGFGLCWNEKKEGILLSGSDDNKICLWDINSAREFRSTIQPLNEINYHQKAVNVSSLILTQGRQIQSLSSGHLRFSERRHDGGSLGPPSEAFQPDLQRDSSPLGDLQSGLQSLQRAPFLDGLGGSLRRPLGLEKLVWLSASVHFPQQECAQGGVVSLQ